MDKKLNLQCLRAVAASLVVVDHAMTNEIRHGALSPTLFPVAWFAGWMGVAYFFVTAGYVMLSSTEGKFGGGAASADFIWRRLVRIVPMYWLVTLATIAVERHAHSVADLIRSLLFIPYHHAADGALLLRG
jgi:peptidoglycan/LPS O-acetylase OafA/YrhL